MALQALLTIDDGAFFVLEGTGQAGSFPGMAWGSGFVTDTATLQQYNISDPIPFFENLMGLPELYTRIVFSPHVYGPNVTVRSPRDHRYWLILHDVRLFHSK